jgi:hypothetical protein
MHVKDPFDSIIVITTLQIDILGGRRGRDYMVVDLQLPMTVFCMCHLTQDCLSCNLSLFAQKQVDAAPIPVRLQSIRPQITVVSVPNNIVVSAPII